MAKDKLSLFSNAFHYHRQSMEGIISNKNDHEKRKDLPNFDPAIQSHYHHRYSSKIAARCVDIIKKGTYFFFISPGTMQD